MKLVLVLIFLAGWFSSLAVLPAQEKVTPQVVIRADGGESGRMESIFIPPKANAPFDLQLATEWSRPMGTGGTFTLVNERRIARDERGRIYQERWILVPKDGKVKSWMDVIQITDPERHTWLNCIVAEKICDVKDYSLTTATEYGPPVGETGPLPNGNGFRQHEDLGLRDVEGVGTHGYRESTTLNPGVMGNDKPMVTMREFWYSRELGVNLISIVETPGTGKQLFTVKNLSTSSPGSQLFQAPPSYRLVDERRGRGEESK